MLIVSVLVGLVVTALAVSWVAQRGSIASNKVAVAIMDIELGSRLNPQMLTTIDWPSGSIPDGSFAELKELQDRVVKTSIQKGEAILASKLAPVGSQGGLSAVIANGKRAMTVRVNDVAGVAGFALPGNYVDVMLSAQQDVIGGRVNGQQQQFTKTVLENVLVLAVAQEAGRDDTKPKVVSAVTLELTPTDAEKLDLARNVGTLSLVLRNQIDQKPVAAGGITRDELLGIKEEPTAAIQKVSEAKPPAKVAKKPKVKLAALPRNCVEVVHNNTRVMNCF